MPLPNDFAAPGLTPDDCYSGDEENEYAIQDGRRKRAIAMSFFAREEGCQWQAVTCLRRYIRLWTRQESWEYMALSQRQDDAIDDWAADNDLQYDRRLDLWFVDKSNTAWLPPVVDERVPDDWRPDDDPVWSFCDRSHPGAMLAWQLEGPE